MADFLRVLVEGEGLEVACEVFCGLDGLPFAFSLKSEPELEAFAWVAADPFDDEADEPVLEVFVFPFEVAVVPFESVVWGVEAVVLRFEALPLKLRFNGLSV